MVVGQTILNKMLARRPHVVLVALFMVCLDLKFFFDLDSVTFFFHI